MRLFSLIGWPHIRKHTLRYALLVAGIALGVAVAVALRAGTQSAIVEFRQTVSHLAGASQLQVSAGEAGVPDSLIEKIQSLAEVSAASPVIQALAERAGQEGAQILLIGVDVTGDGSMRPWLADASLELDPITFLAQPDSILVSRSYAQRQGWSIGSKLALRTMAGPREFTVRGLLDAPELDRVHGGNLVVMDIYGAQQVLGRGVTVDWIDVALAEGVPIEAGQEAVAAAVGPGYTVESPSARGDQLEELLASYESLLAMASLFAIALGVSMIDVSFRLAVARRRPEIGVLRSLGATRWQIQKLFLVEGAITGALGSLLGLLAGAYLDVAVARTVSVTFRGTYGGLIDSPADSPLSPDLILLAFGLGMGVSLISCWLPSREAARTLPAATFRSARYQQALVGWRPWALAASVVLGVLSYLIERAAGSSLLSNVALVMLFVAMVLALPSIVLVVLRPLRPLMARLFGLEGVLALDSVMRAPRRTVNTMVVLLLAFAQTVLVAGVTHSSRATLSAWVNDVFQADLLINSSSNPSAQWFRFPEELAGELAQVPGVAGVEAVRSVRVPFRGRPVLLFAADGGQPRGTVYISENLATREGIKVGSMIEIPAPNGRLRRPVTGVVSDLSDKRGAIFIERSLYRELWNDSSVDKFRIRVEPNVSVEDVRTTLRAALGERYPATIFTLEEFSDFVRHPEGRKVSAAQIQFRVCLVVAALALANLALISVVERRHEIAVLRSIGALRRQVRKTLLVELLVTGCVSLALGLATGALMLVYLLDTIHRHIAGIHLAYAFPWHITPWLGGIALVCGGISMLAALPALRRIPLSTALESE